MPSTRCLLLCLLALVAGAASARAAGPAEPKLGAKIDPFTLKDADGKAWSLADAKDQKAVVVLFLGTECPVNNAYAPRLAELHKAYADKGVAFVAVNANPQDTPKRVAEHAKKYGIPFPVLRDEDNRVADRFGARRTPEAFLLDAGRALRYHGRIDDQFGVGYKRPQPTRRDLAEALDELLAGKAVSQPKTEASGCLISRAVTPGDKTTVTYSKDVARILQNNCQECHRPGQIGPMALLTYDDAASWSAMMKEVVQQRRMPPWHADPAHGKFQNDRRLADKDRDALLAWIDQGCPEGDKKDLPKPREFAEGWRIGKPDVVLTMKEEYKVPARAGDRGIRYQYFIVPTDFKEDVWVQAAEAKPGNREVVHHIIAYVKDPRRPQGNREDGIGDGFLVGYAPGDMPLVLEPGQAKRIPKGSVLAFQMHYTPNGKEQTDRSSVGLVLAKGPPKYEVKTRAIANGGFLIPAGDADHKVTSRSTFRQDTLLLSFLPHMHLRGKSFEYRVVHPDGKAETLMAVPKYDFNWQSNYRLDKPLLLKAGSRIECTASFDNSKDNPNNPDPTKAVKWGDQTWEEMMIGFVDYVVLPEGGEK